MQPIITTTLYLLTILIPLVFTTVNYELFEFPKFILLLAGTLVITTAWIIHVFQTRDYEIIHKGTPKFSLFLHYSVLGILFTQTLSTLFSINPYTSFWGYYSRFHGGLVTTICYTIIYFSAIKWLDSKSTQKLIKISVGTAFFVGLYGILEHLGIDKNYWVQDVQNRVFSTLGQPNWLAAYLIPNIFLTLYLSLTNKNKKEVLPYIISATLFAALLFTKSRSGFLAFIFSYISFWILLIRQFDFKKVKISLYRHSIFLVIVLLIFGSPFSPKISSLFTPKPLATPAAAQGTVLESGGTESGDIRKIVWTGTLKLIEKYPLIGTGPETFAYTYYWTRPTTHNMTSEWDFLYNKAHNEYLNIAANTGLLGLFSYLTWHFIMILNSLRLSPRTKKIIQDKEDSLRMFYPVLGSSVVAFFITNFFGFSVIPVYLMMIIISALRTSLSQDPIKTTPFNIFHSLFFILVLIYPLRLFLADINYSKGKKLFDVGQVGTALPYLQKAIDIRPGLDLFHSTLGEAYGATGQKEQALKELKINLKLNSYHLNFYKSRAKIYISLASIDPKYHVQAAEELENARKLAPTDPKLAYNLGLVYTRLDQTEKSERQFLDAISLKPNYAEPYYALTLLYEQTKELSKIKSLLTEAKANLATYSAQLKEKIEKYTN